MQEDIKSDVEMYWDAVAQKFGNNREWTNLHPQEQMMIIQSINLVMAVLRNPPQPTSNWQ